MTIYHRRQTSYRSVGLFAALFGVPALIALLGGARSGSSLLVIAGAYVVLFRMPFVALDAQVTTEDVRGGRTIPVDSVTSHEPTRNPWYCGLGGPVRVWGSGGWAYSVWDLDAVEIRYEDPRRGPQRFRIGTDDVEGLQAAIEEAMRRPGSRRSR